MNGLVLAVSLVGAVAVISFIASLVVGGRSGRSSPLARRLLLVAGIAGGVCAVLGVLFAIIPSAG